MNAFFDRLVEEVAFIHVAGWVLLAKEGIDSVAVDCIIALFQFVVLLPEGVHLIQLCYTLFLFFSSY